MSDADEARAELLHRFDRLEALDRVRGQRLARRREQVSISAMVGTADAPPQLVQLRKPHAVRAIDDDRVGSRHVDTALDESTPSENVAVLAKDGPIYLTGDLEILDAGGEVILKDTRIALCRCGASKTKPLCDNAHRKSGFKDSGAIKFVQQDADDPAIHPKLRIQPSPNGPLLIDGDVTIIDSSGASKSQANSPAFCRCGASGAKPFCDGSHNRVNFSDQ